MLIRLDILAASFVICRWSWSRFTFHGYYLNFCAAICSLPMFLQDLAVKFPHHKKDLNLGVLSPEVLHFSTICLNFLP